MTCTKEYFDARIGTGGDINRNDYRDLIAHLEFDGDPLNAVAPEFVGQECLDRLTGAWFRAAGPTASDWRRVQAPRDDAVSIADLGAKADGTDVTAKVQAAIDRVVAAGGSEVLAPPGTFRVANVVLKTGVRIRGSGKGRTIFKLIDNAPAGASVFRTANIDTLRGKTGSELLANDKALLRLVPYAFAISNLTIDGNKANNPTAGAALDIFGGAYKLENLDIRYAKGAGWKAEYPTGVGSSTLWETPIQYTAIDVDVFECDGHGLDLNGPSDSKHFGGMVYQNALDGVHIETYASGLKFDGMHCWGTNQDRGWYIGGAGITLANCHGEGASIAQVDIEEAGCKIVGGRFYGGVGEPNGLTGIRIASGSYKIATSFSNFTAGAVNFASDFGGWVEGEVYYSHATSLLYAGTPSRKSTVRLRAETDSGGVARQGLSYTAPELAPHAGIRSAFTSLYFPLTRAPSADVVALAANTWYAFPFRLPGVSFNRARAEVTVAAGVAAWCRVAVYLNDPATALPGVLLKDLSSMPVDTIGVKDLASFGTVNCPDGVIWLVAVCSAACTMRRGVDVPSGCLELGAPDLQTVRSALSLAQAYPSGGFPAVAPAFTGFSADGPLVGLFKV